MLAYKFLNVEFGLKSLSERRLKISHFDDLNDPFELIPYDLSNPTSRLAMQRTRDQLSRNRGMLCFSATRRDPVLWAHYADKHRGLCIGFEIPKEVSEEVEYVSKRLPFPKTLTLEDVHVAKTLLFTKYSNWAYEKEIRIFVALNDKQDGLYFYDFNDKVRPVVVIVGPRCVASRSEIERALGSLAKTVKLIKARPGFSKFEVVKDLRGFRQ